MRDAVSAEADSLAPYRERIMLSMGAAAVVVLTPFTLNDFVRGRWVVGIILLLVQLVLLINVNALWRGRTQPIPMILLLVPYAIGITAATLAQGIAGIFWCYPVVVSTYFITSRRNAVFCSLAMLVYFTALTSYFIDPALAVRLFFTLLLTIFMITIVLNVVADQHRILTNQALTDVLTGIFNRRFLDQTLAALVARAQRHPITASLLMIDADHFKAINDVYGHDQGDLALRRLARLIEGRTRQGEKLFRWGGEEFALLLEDTDADGAAVVAEDVRRGIEVAEILPQRSVTVSIGVAQYRVGQTVDGWTKSADAALYEAKGAGRNRVVVAKVVSSVSLVA